MNKHALNQVEVLIPHQLNAEHERKAIRKWGVDNAGDDPDMLRTLPELQTGEAMFWSPSWLRVLRQIKVSRKHTHDASSTPTLGDAAEAVKGSAFGCDSC